MKTQITLSGRDDYKKIHSILSERKIKKLCVVQGKTKKFAEFQEFLQGLPIEMVTFSDFSSNPATTEVEKGIALFQKENCEGILAVGGGSAIDVAKGILCFHHLKPPYDFMKPDPQNGTYFIALPTTSGSGSESTPFSVLYKNKEKISLHHELSLPDCVILEPRFLVSLPLYQKKCTMLDALCQSIESYWSVYATAESRELAKKGIRGVLQYEKRYLNNEMTGLEGMMIASNFSGQAIAITKTTAPHAMGYGLTTTFGLPHGHSVSLGLAEVWGYMIEHIADDTVERKTTDLQKVLDELEELLVFPNGKKGLLGFRSFLAELEIEKPIFTTEAEFLKICNSVNVDRLANHPMSLSEEALLQLYENIIMKEGI
ncbi:MAG: phosphonoacetaldehyde reductase [Bacillota bacterium]